MDGTSAVVWAPGGPPKVVFDLTIVAERIAAIDLIADPERLRDLQVTIVDEL